MIPELDFDPDPSPAVAEEPPLPAILPVLIPLLPADFSFGIPPANRPPRPDRPGGSAFGKLLPSF